MRRLFALLLGTGISAGCAGPAVTRPVVAPSPVATRLVPITPRPFPIAVVELTGDPAALGTSHGHQLCDPIHQLHDQYLMVFIRGQTQRFFALAAASVFEGKLRPEHRAEVVALAKATGIAESETMLGQCFLDLSQLSGCSTIALPAAASPDHVARFGRNLDFWSLNVADKYTTVFIVRPTDGRYGFASVGWPGMIGVLSGMNQHGLCLANMEVPRSNRLPTAMPYTLLYRSVLERCRTVDEAIVLLKATPHQTANNLMLMDAIGDRAVVELSPGRTDVRRADDHSALISTNHQRDQDADTAGRCDRYDYLHDTSRQSFGEESEPAIEKMLAHVGRHGTLQSMVFEPADRVIYLSAGQDAARKEFHRLNLSPYFAAR